MVHVYSQVARILLRATTMPQQAAMMDHANTAAARIQTLATTPLTLLATMALANSPMVAQTLHRATMILLLIAIMAPVSMQVALTQPH